MTTTRSRRFLSRFVLKRNYRKSVPRRTFQTIGDTSHRVLYGITFTYWGQEDITLESVLNTFGELP